MLERERIRETAGFYKRIEAACLVLALTGLGGLIFRSDLNQPLPFSQQDSVKPPIPIVKEYDPSVKGRLSQYPIRLREPLQSVAPYDDEIDLTAIGFGLLMVVSGVGAVVADEKRKDVS